LPAETRLRGNDHQQWLNRAESKAKAVKFDPKFRFFGWLGNLDYCLAMGN
jgi:hypothetical protein